MVTVTYSVMIILHHFNLVEQAKLYFTAVIPFWYVITIVSIGGYFSQSISAAATIVITYLMYRNQIKLRNGLLIYNILLYILPTLYINFFGPIFGVHDYPIDEIVVFLLCIGWISIVFYIYEGKTQDYIDSLELKNKELNQKTLELERFTYIASHDLKSPLRNITSFLNLIKRNVAKGDHENLHEYIEYAETGAMQMNELITGVLEVSKINTTVEASSSLIDLNSTLKKALFNIKKDIDDKNAKVQAGKLPFFFCNEADFVIIFQNIIQNGIKYNKSEIPIITITNSQQEDFLLIEIKDNGIGIAKEYQEQIFEFFKRLHTSNEFQGTGLGLGLVKKLVEKYDGKIEVKSQEGEYSNFRIVLPVAEHIPEDVLVY